jgi:hypothetical protein
MDIKQTYKLHKTIHEKIDYIISQIVKTLWKKNTNTKMS